jgi:hypothetical protein
MEGWAATSVFRRSASSVVGSFPVFYDAPSASIISGPIVRGGEESGRP